MDAHRISTDAVPHRQAFAYWQDVICDTFIHLDCESARSAQFQGELVSAPLGGLTLSSMTSDAIALRRTKARISAAREEFCLIVVQGKGRTLAEQDGRQAILEAGDLSLFDSARPYFAELQPGFHHYVIKVPREGVRRHFSNIELVTATSISGKSGIGKIASEFFRGIADELGQLDDYARQKLAETGMNLFVAALAGATPHQSGSASSTRIAHLMRAKAFVSANIQRFDLAPEHVAAAIGVSERYLRELFAAEGLSVSRYVWAYRSEKCKAALADPTQANRAISEIAFAWGFNDMSHFSRSFRERTGVSPREFREAALRTSPPR